ncbi:GNAT family N-acetyltransferase [Maribacter sp. X9]|uniref:GNAT family N-acetyltransferase n=1 Tax=Maribacter sp. X9 TaxID=3402159 RepID=UPI003AF3B91E
MDLKFTTTTTSDELLQILTLQQMNLKSAISELEMANEGFVTVEHDYKLLKRMNDVCPHILAKDGDKVVGYALSMDPSFGQEILVLQPMFDELKKRNIIDFLAMGQICVAKTHRKQGIFRGLYEEMKKNSFPKYEYIITEVDATNSRSLGAHLAIGFDKICTYHSLGQDWELISLKTH